MPLSKSKIAQNFNRAALTYDRFASFQHEIGKSIVDAVVKFESDQKDSLRIGDLGCGTGETVRALFDKGFLNITGFDIAGSMLVQARKKCGSASSFLQADIESLPVMDGAFDLVVSNAAIQWCSTATVINEIHRILKPNGRALINTFGPATLQQWRSAFNKVGLDRVHTFDSVDVIKSVLQGCGFTHFQVGTRDMEVQFTSVSAMFDSVRKIGAGNAQGNANNDRISKSDLTAIKKRFETTLQTDGCLPLTYEVIHIVAER